MNDQLPTTNAAEWDGRQWASGDAQSARGDTEAGRGDAVPRWSLWEWASIPPPATVAQVGVGDSALSGYGHNPGAQRWGVRYRPPR
jgi:hypothetical protein